MWRVSCRAGWTLSLAVCLLALALTDALAQQPGRPITIIVPYSPEYLRFRSNPIVLQDIAEKTGGTVLSKEHAVDEIYKTHRKPKQSSRPIFDWFLIALALSSLALTNGTKSSIHSGLLASHSA